jgi:hypothetical protein
MHPSFESMAISNALGLLAYLMDIYHDTSLKSILEDNSISLASRTCIHSCLGKGVELWLVDKPSIHSFRITHYTFTPMFHFHFDLI